MMQSNDFSFGAAKAILEHEGMEKRCRWRVLARAVRPSRYYAKRADELRAKARIALTRDEARRFYESAEMYMRLAQSHDQPR
jgi:hypothetical protein